MSQNNDQFDSEQERLSQQASLKEQKKIEKLRDEAWSRLINSGLAGIFFLILGILPHYNCWFCHLQGLSAMIVGLLLAIPILLGLFFLDTAVGKPFRNYLFPD